MSAPTKCKRNVPENGMAVQRADSEVYHRRSRQPNGLEQTGTRSISNRDGLVSLTSVLDHSSFLLTMRDIVCPVILDRDHTAQHMRISREGVDNLTSAWFRVVKL